MITCFLTSQSRRVCRGDDRLIDCWINSYGKSKRALRGRTVAGCACPQHPCTPDIVRQKERVFFFLFPPRVVFHIRTLSIPPSTHLVCEEKELATLFDFFSFFFWFFNDSSWCFQVNDNNFWLEIDSTIFVSLVDIYLFFSLQALCKNLFGFQHFIIW